MSLWPQNHPSPVSAALPTHTQETTSGGGHPQATELGDGAPCKVGTRSHLMLTGTIITSGHEAGTSMIHFPEDTQALGTGLAYGLFGKWADHSPQPSAPCIVSLFSTKPPHVFWGSPPRGRPLHLAPLAQPRPPRGHPSSPRQLSRGMTVSARILCYLGPRTLRKQDPKDGHLPPRQPGALGKEDHCPNPHKPRLLSEVGKSEHHRRIREQFPLRGCS